MLNVIATNQNIMVIECIALYDILKMRIVINDGRVIGSEEEED